MIKHTQGPWTCITGEVWAGDTPVALMHREYHNGTTPTERDSNARLIAAAPELLEALRLAEDEMCGATFEVGQSKRRCLDYAIDKARTAIKKATEDKQPGDGQCHTSKT